MLVKTVQIGEPVAQRVALAVDRGGGGERAAACRRHRAGGRDVHKISQGGWFPVAVGIVLFRADGDLASGRALAAQHASTAPPLDAFLHDVLKGPEPPARVSGMAGVPDTLGATPSALESNVHHNRVLHQTVVIFANRSESAPRVDEHTHRNTRSRRGLLRSDFALRFRRASESAAPAGVTAARRWDRRSRA